MSTVDELRKLAEANGEVTQHVKNRVMFIALADISDKLDELGSLAKRVEKLEHHDLVAWLKDHKQAATLLAGLAVVLLYDKIELVFRLLAKVLDLPTQ